MKTTEIDYLDGEFQVNESEPSTITECVELIGEDAVVDETTSNLRYRNKYPRVYRKVSDLVAGKHSFPRIVLKEETKKDGTIKKVYESENNHLRAFLKGRFDGETQVSPAPEGSRDILQTLFTEVATSEPLYVKGERTGGTGKISQAAMDAANTIVADGREEEVAGQIESLVPGYKVGRDVDGNTTIESIARGVQALEKHLANKAKRDAAALLGKK